MNYSTLKEAYSIDSFDKEKKKSKKSKSVARIEEFEDDASDISQRDVRPSASIPIKNTEIKDMERERPNVLKGVQPHYDEELEKYLNINDFQSTNTDYYPQDYNHSKPQQNVRENSVDEVYGSDDRYQPKQLYYRPVTRSYQNNVDISEPTFRPIQPVQQVQYAPQGQHVQHVQHAQNAQYVPQAHNVQQVQQAQRQIQPMHNMPRDLEPKETFYKNMVNIGLFIFIGILIIFLCDQITEIAINIGMKRTMMLLEPYMNMNMNMNMNKDSRK